ncbi:MAG: hypothetical protein EA352_11995, partial [Gemmatimonadales bacterium]
RSPEGEVLAVASESGGTVGVQFHPESILTEYGHRLLENALRLGQEATLPEPSPTPDKRLPAGVDPRVEPVR